MNEEDDGSRIVEDDGPLVIVKERDGDQALWVRVGPVFSPEQESELGVWVEYQEKYMGSDMQGPLLFSKETWIELNDAVMARFDRASAPAS